MVTILNGGGCTLGALAYPVLYAASFVGTHNKRVQHMDERHPMFVQSFTGRRS
jgi:hypothetical protein